MKNHTWATRLLYTIFALSLFAWIVIPFVLPSIWTLGSGKTVAYEGEVFTSPSFTWTWLRAPDKTVGMFKLSPTFSLDFYKPQLITIGPRESQGYDLSLWQDRYTAFLNGESKNNNAHPVDLITSHGTIHCVKRLHENEKYESILYCVDDHMIIMSYYGPDAHLQDFYGVLSSRRPAP